jgi:hypothetical protein
MNTCQAFLEKFFFLLIPYTQDKRGYDHAAPDEIRHSHQAEAYALYDLADYPDPAAHGGYSLGGRYLPSAPMPSIAPYPSVYPSA